MRGGERRGREGGGERRGREGGGEKRERWGGEKRERGGGGIKKEEKGGRKLPKFFAPILFISALLATSAIKAISHQNIL
jgi:hypothetical protein